MAYLSKAQARVALRAAIQTRRQANVAIDSPINVFDFAEKLGIEVKFAGIGSFGGMWVKQPKTILVPSQQPPGRQAFTCAHELGHWCFGHGTKVDLIDCQEAWTSNDEEELLANAYGGFLLMPIWTFKRCFERRQWTIGKCSPLQVFTIAGQLGVSYEALIKHACFSLDLMSRKHSDELLSTTPRKIASQVMPNHNGSRLLVIDSAWETVPIDLQVGEYAALPRDTQFIGKCVRLVASYDQSKIVEAMTPGMDRVWTKKPDWSAFVRVCRKEFEGRSTYRHLEDPDSHE